jgi:hypothetical protein
MLSAPSFPLGNISNRPQKGVRGRRNEFLLANCQTELTIDTLRNRNEDDHRLYGHCNGAGVRAGGMRARPRPMDRVHPRRRSRLAAMKAKKA